MKQIILATGNREKIAIATEALAGTGYDLIAQKIKCEEIQSDEVSEVAKYSAKYASDQIQKNVVKIDSGLFIEALRGFPGPYSQYVERCLTAGDILRLMLGVGDRNAYYKEALAYCEYGKDPVVFETYTHGFIAQEESGGYGMEFDKIFICKDDKDTMANYMDSERIRKYSHENWGKLIEFLDNE